MLAIPILLIGAGLAGCVALIRSFKSVQAGTVAIPLRFGKPIGTLEPGLQRRIPGVDDWILIPVAPFARKLVARSITHDGLDIGVRATLQLKVIEPDAFAHHQAFFDHSADAILGSAASDLIGQHDHDELMLKREQFRDQLRFTIDHRLESMGLTVQEVFLEAVEPNRSAALLRATAAQQSIRSELLIAQAHVHKTLQIIEAEGRAQMLKAIDEVACTAHANTMQLAHFELLRNIGHPPSMAAWAPPPMWAPPIAMSSLVQ